MNAISREDSLANSNKKSRKLMRLFRKSQWGGGTMVLEENL